MHVPTYLLALQDFRPSFNSPFFELQLQSIKRLLPPSTTQTLWTILFTKTKHSNFETLKKQLYLFCFMQTGLNPIKAKTRKNLVSVEIFIFQENFVP